MSTGISQYTMNGSWDSGVYCKFDRIILDALSIWGSMDLFSPKWILSNYKVKISRQMFCLIWDRY